MGGITDDFDRCCITASHSPPRSGVAAALQLPAAEVVVLASPLHSITQTFCCTWYSSDTGRVPAELLQYQKKIKKDLTDVIEWDIKG